MPRPKGSRNKSATNSNVAEVEAEQFDYESQGDNDDLYTAIMTGQGEANPATAVRQHTAEPRIKRPEKETFNMQMPSLPVVKESDFDQLFFIEGKVRRDAIGEDAVFAEQKRLVWASSFEKAVQKFNVYFANLSNNNERYTVIMAGGTEAIQ